MADGVKRKSEFDDVYERLSTAWHDFNVQACLDLDFFLRAQYDEDDRDRADEQNRILYTFDKINRQVNLLHGYEIRNRHILKIGPVGNYETQEDEACNQHTGVVMSVMSRHSGYDTLSKAFKWGTLVQGSNLIEQWRDREGNIQFGRLGFNQFLIDDGITKDDLSDCQDILTGQWISAEKAKMLVPTRAGKINKIAPLTSSRRWEFQAQPAMQNKGKKRLYEQWWHRETEEVDMVQSRATGEKMTFEQFAQQYANSDKELAQALIDNNIGPNGIPVLVKFRETKDKIRLTIFIDDEFVWEGDNPLGIRDFNYTWVHGSFCPEATQSALKIQSFVRGIRDPQRALNRRVNQIIDLIETTLQGIRITRHKYLMNPEDTFKTGQGVNLMLKDDAPDEMTLTEMFRQIPGAEVPQSLFAALEMVDKAETEIGGLNQEIFGEDDKNKEISGVLHAYRTGKALTGQAWMFQDFRASKRDLGRKQVQIVQMNYPPQRIQKILNQTPVPGFYDDDVIRFDCSPTEGFLTDSQQNMYYQELKELKKEFPEEGRAITLEMLVEASPTQYKNRTLQAIRQAQKAAQQAGQAQTKATQDAAQLTNALTAVQISQAQENIADAQEKRSQIPLNNAKTVTEINKNLASPLVDLIKEQVKLQVAKLGVQSGNDNR